MKKVLIIFSGLVVVVFLIGVTSHYVVAQKSNCTTIKDGTLTYAIATGYPNHYLGNELLKPGFDVFGYNYQAHLFNGSYANIYLCRAGFPPYEGDDAAYLAENPTVVNHWAWPERNTTVMMKWSDVWLSNKDCNGDGKLDRGYSCDPVYADNSACKGAWVTNHMLGTYEVDGKECHWTYFVKIVMPPVDAYKEGGYWYTDDTKETEIGQVVWGSFARIQQISNDPCQGEQGILYKSPVGPGFGKY